MSKSTRITLAILGMIVLGISSGFLGATIRGGGSGSSGGASTNGAWIQKIIDQGELRVGIASAPPMTGEQPDGTMGGPNVLPLQNLAESLGVKFTAVPAEWASLVSGLQADQFDLAAYLDATPARSLAIQFTDPVYTYEGVWIVKGDSGLKNTEDILAAGPIALANGTSYFPVIQALGPKDIVGTESIPDSIAAMAAGRAVAAFGDLPTLADAASKNPDLKIVVPTPALFVQDSNYGVNQDVDARSMNVLNIAIRTAQNNGTLGAAFDKAGIITIDTLGDLRMQ